MSGRKDSDERRKAKAGIREDLTKRLFAVAISVGFGAALWRMDWAEQGILPTAKDVPQFAILAVAMTATVLSWDGYLISIKAKPLFSFWRYLIDIVLVFTYMVLLMTSSSLTFWLPILAGIFSLYCIWDFLTIREHYNKYVVGQTEEDASIKQALVVYLDGFRNRMTVTRGPVVTLCWAIYFWVLLVIGGPDGPATVCVKCAFALAGLIVYRRDKEHDVSEDVRGFDMRVRAILIVFLLVVAALVFCVLGHR